MVRLLCPSVSEALTYCIIGEGALIAMKGSPLGIGSDIGGSVRIPSAFCGIYGLRPSAGRVPYLGTANSLLGQDSVLSVLGPMSGSAEGLSVLMKACAGREPWNRDPIAVRKRWDDVDEKYTDNGDKLCFGILWDDKDTLPTPPIRRALEITKRALVEAGHTGTFGMQKYRSCFHLIHLFSCGLEPASSQRTLSPMGMCTSSRSFSPTNHRPRRVKSWPLAQMKTLRIYQHRQANLSSHPWPHPWIIHMMMIRLFLLSFQVINLQSLHTSSGKSRNARERYAKNSWQAGIRRRNKLGQADLWMRS